MLRAIGSRGPVISIFLALALLITPGSAAAQGPIRVALDALKFVVKRTTSIATTFAVAHTAAGTGGAGSGLCGPQVSVTGGAVSCTSSDFFGHTPALGNDVATASAFGTSWALGFGGIANAHATALKGDFAAAGAYARGGAAASAIGGSLAVTGMTKATATFSLGGLTLTGAKDPSNSFFAFVVSDQDPLVLNSGLLAQDVLGRSFESYLPSTLPDGLSRGVPTNIFWALLLHLDGATGNLSIDNFGLAVTTPLTLDDFEDLSTSATAVWKLRGSGDFQIDVPFIDLNAEEQVITFDAMHLETAVVPEPATLVLLVSGLAGAAVVRRRSRRSVCGQSS